MKFASSLQEGILLQRYKRFLADVRLSDGGIITLHCPNTGSMLNCADPGSRVWFSVSANGKRKYPGTWEIVETVAGHRIGINTGRANTLAREAMESGLISSLGHYQRIQSEVPYGVEKSRIDFLLGDSCEGAPDCYVEVKSVTLMLEEGNGAFPDAVTARGLKHLRELIQMREQGHRAMLLFCVQHSGIRHVCPADHIHPEYGKLLRVAAGAGVEVVAMGAVFTDDGIALRHQLPVWL